MGSGRAISFVTLGARDLPTLRSFYRSWGWTERDDDGGSYQYNLKTDGLAAGTHRFTFTITGDPTTHTVPVVIR